MPSQTINHGGGCGSCVYAPKHRLRLAKASLAFAVVKCMTCQCQRPTLNLWGDTVPPGHQLATTWSKLITQNRSTLEGAAIHLLFQAHVCLSYLQCLSQCHQPRNLESTDPRSPTTRLQRKDLLLGKGGLAVSTQSGHTSPPT